MNNYFNIKRFGKLSKYEILSDYKSWAVYLITITAIYVGFSLIMAVMYKFTGDSSSPNSINTLYPGFLFIGGYITTAFAFSDVNDKFKNSLWFSLPGSSLEKYLLGFLMSGIGYVVFITGAFSLASIIAAAITQPLFGFSMTIFNPFSTTFFYIVVIYLITQPMFLVGSIVFKKAAFIKTLLTAAAVHFCLVMVVSIIGFVIYKLGIYDSWDQRLFLKFGLFTTEPNSLLLLKHWGIGFGVAFNIFFNIVGYLKLTEKEVKGGI